MSVFDRLTPPATAKLFGTELVAENSSEGVIEFAFHPNETMLNPRGMVQGGIIAAMLDDTMAPALISRRLKQGKEEQEPAHELHERVLPRDPLTAGATSRVEQDETENGDELDLAG